MAERLVTVCALLTRSAILLIDLQSELINEKDKNLHGLKDAVVSSIGGSVQTQLIIVGSCINFSEKVS